MRLPIRARVALVTTALVAVVLGAGAFLLYSQFRAGLLEAVDERLWARLEPLGRGTEIRTLVAEGVLAEFDDEFAQVLGPDGTVLESSPGFEDTRLLTPGAIESLEGSPRFWQQVIPTFDEPVEARLLAAPSGGRVIVVGASLDDQQEALARLATLLVIGGPVALLLVGGVGWVVAGAALRPVEGMRREAAAISASELDRRLPVPGTGDEVALLGHTLNRMLDRLETALERERRFVDDASHELRTPLANLRAELELAGRRARTPEELERVVRSAAEETERLARLAEDLLVLARADRGRLPVRREEVDLGDLIASAVGPFAAAAGARGVAIERLVPAGIRARLDPDRIRQALGNLLDNAVRHTPQGGRVAVEATAADGSLSLEVRDGGPGFAAAFLPRAFEPFARPDPSRSRPDGGAGLGLAIVRAVAEAHGGVAEAANPPGGGAAVVLRIPGAISGAHAPLIEGPSS